MKKKGLKLACTGLALVLLTLGSTQSIFADKQAAQKKPVVGTLTVANKEQFNKTDNPISIGVPLSIPSTTPTIVKVLDKQKFGNAVPSVKSEVDLPSGKWGKVLLTITGAQQGRQYDRLFQIWAGSSQLFVGVTPEPTKDGIEWKIQKDVTEYLPILQGKQVLTTKLENYVNSTYTGVPEMSVQLEFYPEEKGNKEKDDDPLKIKTPEKIVSITKDASPFYLYDKNPSMDVPLDLPNDLIGAYLDLYVVPQNDDEFWWSLQPAFREIEVYVDGQPAGAIWPDPTLFTGGVNPYLWRPIQGINTLDMPSYRVNLTPFAGLLGGKHTLSLKVGQHINYWLLSGSLFLYENDGKPTTGKIVKNTLSFPTNSDKTKDDLFGNDNNLFGENANQSYEIEGTIESKGESYTSRIQMNRNLTSDQTNYNEGGVQLVHNAQVVTSDESFSKRGQRAATKHTETVYTLDCGSGYMTPTNGTSGFLLPSNLIQSLHVYNVLDGPAMKAPYESTLYLNTQGYATLNRASKDTAQGATTATVDFKDSMEHSYHQVLMSHGGQVTYNLELGSLAKKGKGNK
ncbi:peptide-N4-asparagine amidase [Neobacillus massiliamazoniensis]|uniref:Peptide N-acetyl-beta-D-glucosaminyl asparaginase amidase A n=1 Tax=Neobacillus massiliamazoniensis TaxID=1499688 RepID=A0A0U1NXW3_9BACI|nr:peptide-N4-asparagine amidase [Neobacillus massiliamazoniensis]CRK82889.1 Peptide N-acetyl-beta-D-glucosaminyl asparaginase amidase A [Neobacillus massiliamazoniensis]